MSSETDEKLPMKAHAGSPDPNAGDLYRWHSSSNQGVSNLGKS
jgi:hypothetical protein